jgi:ABC-type lipoprotein release transport system permease subunit
VPSFITGRQFAATFKVEKSGINKNVAYLILDKNKNILEASSSAITMLEIDLQKFQKMKAYFDISKHLPSLFGPNFYQYVNKAGSHIDYQYPALKMNSPSVNYSY